MLVVTVYLTPFTQATPPPAWLGSVYWLTDVKKLIIHINKEKSCLKTKAVTATLWASITYQVLVELTEKGW